MYFTVKRTECLDFTEYTTLVPEQWMYSTLKRTVCLDFTSIRRGYMKSLEESTGKPQDGEQIIRSEEETFKKII